MRVLNNIKKSLQLLEDLKEPVPFTFRGLKARLLPNDPSFVPEQHREGFYFIGLSGGSYRLCAAYCLESDKVPKYRGGVYYGADGFNHKRLSILTDFDFVCKVEFEAKAYQYSYIGYGMSDLDIEWYLGKSGEALPFPRKTHKAKPRDLNKVQRHH